jgi:CubicO group peptidase (beta-lactamase class C family)
VTESASPVGPGVTLANWRTEQFLRWSLQHAREFLPTARVARAGAIAELPGTPGSVAGVSLADGSGAATTVGAVIASTYTDGFLVMDHGRVVMEEYLAGMTAGTGHAGMSVTKSLVGCVAAVLIGRGMLDPAAPLTAYVPELAGSGYAGATVRHVLDMRSGIIFSEDYLDPRSEIRRLEQCVGWSLPAEPGLAASIYDFLLTLRQGSAHGGPFAYRSCETDVLGWVCERAAAARMPELMSGLLWGSLGAEHDADISLDRAGLAVHDGGLSAALRDLARFGQMLADGGRSMTGQQVLPAWWVRDTLAGDPDSRAAFAASPTDTRMPGGMYRNSFWVPYPGSAVLLSLGIHGQMVYVNTAANMVGVKLSSWPVPQDPVMLLATLRAFDAITAHLAASGDQTGHLRGRTAVVLSSPTPLWLGDAAR